MTLEAYRGNEKCEAWRIAEVCEELADFRWGDQYYCAKHMNQIRDEYAPELDLSVF